MLVSVLEEERFAQLVSDSPGSGRARRLVFREEAVAALATACAQVREDERGTEREREIGGEKEGERRVFGGGRGRMEIVRRFRGGREEPKKRRA